MNIVKATLVKRETADKSMHTTAPIGKTYLVDLDTIKENDPEFHGHPGMRMGTRLTVRSVCECRGHHTGEIPLELLELEAQA